MRHFYRSHLPPERVLEIAEQFFPTIGEMRGSGQGRQRTFTGTLGTLALDVKMEAGHYTFVTVNTDQMGESRLDRNAKRFFTELRSAEDPEYRLTASF